MTRALVLGGGGPVGIGWESGLLEGLACAGVDLEGFDAIVGTSAGAFVGAQLAAGLELRPTVEALGSARAALAAAEGGGARVAAGMERLMETIAAAATGQTTPEEGRRAIGKAALETSWLSEEAFLDFFAVLQGRPWPARFGCTAVEAESGEFVVWRASDGISLQAGVASSCAVPCVYPPVTINGRRYVDGGMRTGLNADVAVGADAVVAISVMALEAPPGLSNPVFDALLGRISAELGALRSAGAEVVVIAPDAAFLALSGWGASLMDVTKARHAYDLGFKHGVNEAERVLTALVER